MNQDLAFDGRIGAGFNFENDNQHGWLKYGLGLLVLFVAGVYFWFSGFHYQESDQKVPVEVVRVPVVKGEAQVSSSPAVTMLEEKKIETNEKKVVVLKAVIFKKTHSSSGKEQEAGSIRIAELIIVEEAPATGEQQSVETAVVVKIESVLEKKVFAKVVQEALNKKEES